jgi:hypothetical protein
LYINRNYLVTFWKSFSLRILNNKNKRPYRKFKGLWNCCTSINNSNKKLLSKYRCLEKEFTWGSITWILFSKNGWSINANIIKFEYYKIWIELETDFINKNFRKTYWESSIWWWCCWDCYCHNRSKLIIKKLILQFM